MTKLNADKYQLVKCTLDGCENGFIITVEDDSKHGEAHDLCQGTGLRESRAYVEQTAQANN